MKFVVRNLTFFLVEMQVRDGIPLFILALTNYSLYYIHTRVEYDILPISLDFSLFFFFLLSILRNINHTAEQMIACF
jgi:hypothetical protein